MSKRASFISSWPARRTKGIGGVLPGGATVDVADAETFDEREKRSLLLLLPPTPVRGVEEKATRAAAGGAHGARETAATTGRKNRAAVVVGLVAKDVDAIEEDASVERIVVVFFCVLSLLCDREAKCSSSLEDRQGDRGGEKDKKSEKTTAASFILL